MAAYFRSLFGSQSNTSSSSGQDNGLYRSRTRSSQSSSYRNIPSPTPSVTSFTSRPGFRRSDSYTAARPTTPSPLRGSPYDSASTHVNKKASPGSYSKSKSIPAHYQTPQQRSGETGVQYHVRAPSAPYITPTSSRTGSAASLHPGASGAPFMSPLTRSTSHSVRSKPSRSALKQSGSWAQSTTASSTGYASSHTRSHVTFHSPAGLHMHPLFAHSRLHHAPIDYDVIHAPSARSVLDSTIHSPVPAHTLSQPATDPPTSVPDQLVLRSHKFPWTIVVTASGPAVSGGSGPSKRMARTHSRSSSMQGNVITNLDVLYTVHTTLLSRVTPEEWEALGNGSKTQRKVTRAYERRCTLMGGWEGGVRRVDWLGGKTHLSGIEVDKTSGTNVGKLIFSKG